MHPRGSPASLELSPRGRGRGPRIVKWHGRCGHRGGGRWVPDVLPELVLGLAAPHGLRTATLAVSPFWESGSRQPGVQAQAPPEAGLRLKAPLPCGPCDCWWEASVPYHVTSPGTSSQCGIWLPPRGWVGGGCRGLGAQSQDATTVTPSSSETSAKGGPHAGGWNDHVSLEGGCPGQPLRPVLLPLDLLPPAPRLVL